MKLKLCALSLVYCLLQMNASLYAGNSGVLVSSSADKTKNKSSVLVSDPMPAKKTSAVSKPSSQGKITLKFKPREQTAPETGEYVEEEVPSKLPKTFKSESDEYSMGTSKRSHPASARPDATNPIVQTVNGPVTVDYSRARPAKVLDPGRQKGSGSGRASVTGRLTSN